MIQTRRILIIIFLLVLVLFGEYQYFYLEQSSVLSIIYMQLYLIVIIAALYFWRITGALFAFLAVLVSHALLAYFHFGYAMFQITVTDILPIGLLFFNSILISAASQLREAQLHIDTQREIQHQIHVQQEQQRTLTDTVDGMKKDILRLSSLIINLAEFAKKINLAEFTTPSFDEKNQGNSRILKLIDATLEALAKTANTVYCSIYLLEHKQNQLVQIASYGKPLQEPPPKEISFGNGLLGKVAETRQVMRYEWTSKENWNTALGKTWLTELMIGIPISYQNKLRGTIYIEKSGVEFKDERLVLETMAEFIGMALQNAEIFDRSQQLAISDGLTKLYNHEYLLLRLREFVSTAKRYHNPLSLIMFDIDYFKHYNDTNGHPMGDVVLEEVAYLLRKNTRETDIAARYGGEEFTLILQQTDLSGALIVAEKIRKAIESYHFYNEEKQPNGNLTISAGVATLTELIDIPEKLLKQADEALYTAKQSGRNKVCSTS